MGKTSAESNRIQKESVMARKYTKEELKERLQRSIYKVVAEEGIEGVTVRKVSKGCGNCISSFMLI